MEQMHDELEEYEEKHQNNIQQQQLPEYGAVEGQVIKLKGLDYNLLQQEKNREEQSKRNLFDSLKNKINIISGNVLDRALRSEGIETDNEKQRKNDAYFKSLQKVFEKKEQISHFNEKKKSEKYFEFELDEFGRRIPIIVQKRIGKSSNQPTFVHFDENFINQFNKLIKIKEKAFVNAQKIIAEMGNNQNNDDDDDIFGNNSQEEVKQEKPTKSDEKMGIKIGRKLNFGLQDDILASGKRMRTPGSVQEETPQEVDKYFFMGKKVKRNVQQIDGYDECYYQSGPSLQELVDLKKQGIQYYGDIKEFKPKEKKGPNISKDYEKIQKIIEKKNQK